MFFADMSVSVVRPKCLENLRNGLLLKNGWEKIAPINLMEDRHRLHWQLPSVEHWLKKNFK